MTYQLKKTTKFKKDFNTCIKRGLDLKEFEKVLDLLIKGSTLPERYLDHPLHPNKNYLNCRELHIQPNWLLVYKYSKETLILYLVRTGSHSDLFRS